MAVYEIEITRAAERQIDALPRADRGIVVGAIQALAYDPRPYRCRKMRGTSSWRLRIGRYRVIYDIGDFRLLVLVLKAGHRKDIYR